MIIVIHGDDTTAARNYLFEKLENQKVERINGKKLDEAALDIALSNTGLFSEKKTILIEHFSSFSKTHHTKFLPLINEYAADKFVEIYIFEEKILDKRILLKLRNPKIQDFILPKFFFTFLDTFTPRNSVRLHELLFKLYPALTPEQIMYALVNRMRLLLMLKLGNGTEYEETAKLAPWQKTKLIAQTRAWSEKSLVRFYTKLFDTEVAMKTSALSMPLINHLDFLIVSELQ